jgi:hypothetical protein
MHLRVYIKISPENCLIPCECYGSLHHPDTPAIELFLPDAI